MKKNIKIILKMPNEAPIVKNVDCDYEFLSKFCEGLIEFVSFPDDNSIDIVCNDEFLYLDMDTNIVMPEYENVMCGPLVFVGYNPEDGSTIGLTDDQIKKCLEYIKRNEVHNMSIQAAYRYSKVMKDYQKSLDDVRGQTDAKFCNQ